MKRPIKENSKNIINIIVPEKHFTSFVKTLFKKNPFVIYGIPIKSIKEISYKNI